MKITKKQLTKIIQEELTAIQELGPETGHEEGTDAVDVVKMIGDDLIEVAGEMREMPSHIPASNVAGFIESKGKEALEAHAELAGGLRELQTDPAYDAKGGGDRKALENAVYALEDNVIPVLYGGPLERQANELHKAIYALIGKS